MAQATLERVLDDIKTLNPSEWEEIDRNVQRLLERATKEAEREKALAVLEKSGMVDEVKRPPLTGPREYRPVTIEGEPISETIIRERR